MKRILEVIDKMIEVSTQYSDDDWVLVDGRKVVKYIKAPKSGKAPSGGSFTKSRNQELIKISKAKQMGIL